MMMCMLEKLLIEESFNGTLPIDFCINDFLKNMEKDLQNINQMKKMDMAEENVVNIIFDYFFFSFLNKNY